MRTVTQTIDENRCHCMRIQMAGFTKVCQGEPVKGLLYCKYCALYCVPKYLEI